MTEYRGGFASASRTTSKSKMTTGTKFGRGPFEDPVSFSGETDRKQTDQQAGQGKPGTRKLARWPILPGLFTIQAWW
jgi:hypothetical protein